MKFYRKIKNTVDIIENSIIIRIVVNEISKIIFDKSLAVFDF